MSTFQPRPTSATGCAARPLSGKVALITGSTSGIGLATAKVLAGRGAEIRLNGFGDADAIERLRAEIEEEFSVRATFHATDLADVGAIERLALEVGPIDILVNNAGIQHVAPVEHFPVEKWDSLVAVNLSAVFHMVRLFLPAMRRQKWGRIVSLSSANGLVASANKVAYVAAKHGVVGITKAVALETAGSGITCNAICPGMVRTPLVDRQIEAYATRHELNEADAALEFLKEKQPSGTFIRPEQIGELVAYMCSDAADQMTGSCVSMDGGWTAQ
jgi:3-hydroxybutyrate dehydrogenase